MRQAGGTRSIGSSGGTRSKPTFIPLWGNYPLP
jgi:hypothetical protein